MKTKVFFYSLMMGLVMVSSTLNVFAEEEKKKPVKIEIPMIEDQESAYDDRGLVVIPLKAYYQGETIYLDFTHNVGNVQVSVQNTTTNHQWSKTVNAANGMCEVSFANGGTGNYTITLVTAYGDKFYGIFTIE